MEEMWKKLPEDLYIQIITKIEDPITRHELGLKPRKIKNIDNYNIDFPRSVCKYIYIQDTATFISIIRSTSNENQVFRVDSPVLYNGDYEFQYLENYTEIRTTTNCCASSSRMIKNNYIVHLNFAVIK